jgi:uncharacterized membrane protein
MVLAYDYPLLSVMWSMLVFFGFVLFFWLLITVYMDLFRREDVGGWAKFGWVAFTIVLPFLGVFVYLIAQGRGMSEREAARRVKAQQQMDSYIRSVAAPTGGGSADELAKAKALLDSGAISQAEYDTMKRKALA